MASEQTPLLPASPTPLSAAPAAAPKAHRTLDADTASNVLLPREGGVSLASRWERWSPFMAEFLGSFVLTLTVLCNATCGDSQWYATSNAFMVVVFMYAFSHISGANLNPSVSIAMCLANRLPFGTAMRYIIAQVMGGVLSGLFFHSISDANISVSPKSGFSTKEVFLVEVVYTSMIAFTYLNCVASTSNNPGPPAVRKGFGGLAVGFCYLAAGHVAFDVSTAALNPAITVGMTIVDLATGSTSGWWVTFLTFEIIGAFVANGVYRIVRPNEIGEGATMKETEPYTAPISARIMAEFAGSFYMAVTRGMERLGGVRSASWPIAAAFIAMNYSLGSVSGAHLNPAVTISVALTGYKSMTVRDTSTYIFAQVLSSLAASAAAAGARPGDIPSSSYDDVHSGFLAAAEGEIVFCCLLCYASLVMGVDMPGTQENMRHDAAGLVIGSTLAVGGLAGGRVMNPAIALDFSLINLGQDLFLDLIIYDLLGAAIASALFLVTHGSAMKKEKETEPVDDGIVRNRSASDMERADA